MRTSGFTLVCVFVCLVLALGRRRRVIDRSQLAAVVCFECSSSSSSLSSVSSPDSSSSKLCRARTYVALLAFGRSCKVGCDVVDAAEAAGGQAVASCAPWVPLGPAATNAQSRS